MFLFRMLDWLANVFALTILAGLLFGMPVPSWIGFLLLGIAVGLVLRRVKTTGGEHRAT